MIQPGHASHESCVRFTALPEVHAKMFRVGPRKFTRALSHEPPIPCRRTSLLQPIGHRDRHVLPDLTPQDLRSEPREQLSQSTSVLVCDLPSPIHLYDLRKHNLIYSEPPGSIVHHKPKPAPLPRALAFFSSASLPSYSRPLKLLAFANFRYVFCAIIHQFSICFT
jgi:hypothetical protein